MKRRRRKTHELEAATDHDRPPPAAAERIERDQEQSPDLLRQLQTGLGNAAFGRLLAAEADGPSLPAQSTAAVAPNHRASLLRSLHGGGVIARQPAAIQRDPVDAPDAPPAAIPRAEDLIATKYPQFVKAMTPEHYKAIDDMIKWRLGNEKLNQEIQAFDQREREKQEKEGWAAPGSNSYRFTSDYQDRLRRLQNKQKDPPPVGRIEIDTSKLIDREILAPQEWNIQAEKEFRERWVLALSAHPTILDLYGKYPIEEGFRGPFWNGVALPTTGGMITWDNLLSIPGVITAYWDQVRNSPMARAAREYFAKLQGAYDSAKSEWDSEDDRKSEFPVVSSITEFFSSNIDWKAAEKLLPPGKKFDDMDPWEIMDFLGTIDEAKLERVKAELPSFEKVMKVYEHLLKVDTAVAIGQYEAALVAMPMVADEIEETYRATTSYGRRVNAAASTIVTTLQYVRAGCNIILTVGGGVMGRAYGLLGVAGGSAAGAGIGTFTQETASQLASGKFDPGSILFKTGKDAAMTFISSMIGGALGSKFASILGPRLAPIIPNEAVRQFIVGRVADVGASLLTTPIDVTVTGMLEGDWPKSMDDLLDKVAKNAVRDVIIGGAVDVVTGVPNLKGKAWDQLTETDIQGAPKQLGAGDPAAPKQLGAGDPVAAGKQAADTVAAKDTQTPTGGQAAGGGARGRVISDGAEVVSIDRNKPIGASGFTGSTSDRKGYGVFDARIRLPDGTEVDAVVKILKPNSGNVDADFFAAEVQGAKMAAQSGYGPDFYGTVPMGNDWAFAMGKLEGGGFISNYGRPGEPGFAQAEAETKAAIDALTPQTGQDVRDYGEALWNLGYHAGGDTQGLVMPDGRWRPIDFSGIEKLPADPVEALKLKPEHDKIINTEAASYDKKLEERNKARGVP